jgi:type II secretory ATPase GspE/PulE/Tfp pilus assembly ATPase PilB-like protein
VEKALEALLRRPQGVILLTGPAGSGKTTTIYAALRFIIQSSKAPKNIVSVEDPVECVVEGVSQTQIGPAAGLTFARALRSLMRQDPEVIVIGEIRDRETAEIAMDAGLTGHLVISTIHAGTACGVFTRLLDMGIEPYLLTSAVSAVLAERLVRVLCPECKRPAKSEEEFESLKAALGARAFVAGGCPACLGTGYKGRTPIVELLEMNELLRQAILSKSDTEELARRAKDAGMKTLLDDGIQKIKCGITTPAELRRVLVF